MSRTAEVPDSLHRLQRVLERTGHKRTSWLEMVKRGEAPAPIRIGTRAVAWSEQAITAWIEARKNAASHERAR